MWFGASYYPELIPENEWAADLDAMRENGLDLVRCAEFAWGAFELREGVYTFGWLDRFIAQAASRGMSVILGTPTAAVPQWMLASYPGIAVEMRDGTRLPPGERRLACVNNPVYRHFSAQIAAQMAAR
ncbi:MAG: beta-galactosidase, partial [Kiritimatiellaeota bacterium]|nr:beta-galactosidase [Kiritimatiellota bacterium]